MKPIYAVLILIAGALVALLGMLFQRESWENASELVLLGWGLILLGVLSLVLSRRRKNTLNK